MKRPLYAVAGWLMVALGVIGLVLPVMPTTVFMILAAWFFARSSPRFEAWLLAHPIFGPPIVQWRENGAIPPLAKAFAVVGMAGGFAMFWFLVRPAPWLATLVAAALLASAGFVLSRPSH
ncbi:YbaN family protein [Mesorhizobium sp. BR1-1-16]|uniref:YbaN family protein n=1 Tax=Mesorhizobium sp. BR1-1-16 TaxID=2876653 RepID=UPI001CC9177A|nr:YbaN family protein [Mesorhizobium sp. BR1-1-16]MBZ9934853.1 YbaN family protein [Mesorhizobium sp. BR1-1-16]